MLKIIPKHYLLKEIMASAYNDKYKKQVDKAIHSFYHQQTFFTQGRLRCNIGEDNL